VGCSHLLVVKRPIKIPGLNPYIIGLYIVCLISVCHHFINNGTEDTAAARTACRNRGPAVDPAVKASPPARDIARPDELPVAMQKKGDAEKGSEANSWGAEKGKGQGAEKGSEANSWGAEKGKGQKPILEKWLLTLFPQPFFRG
jgi:hypothetical protein